jgi:ubiquitin-activating enzyme E1
VVALLEDTRIPFEDGEWVLFTEVKGMTELNGQEKKIKILSHYTFSIDDTTGLSPYISGGYVTQVKKPSTITFVSLQLDTQP